MRGQGGRCKPGFFGVFPTGGSRIVSPLGGGVSLLKGAQVAARTGWAAGVCKKMSLNRYCRPRRTPGWRSRVSFAVILESSKKCVMACLASGKVVFQEENQAQVLEFDAATGQRPQFILKSADGLVCASTHAGCGVTVMIGGARMRQSSVLKIRWWERATSWKKPVLTATRHNPIDQKQDAASTHASCGCRERSLLRFWPDGVHHLCPCPGSEHGRHHLRGAGRA